MESESHNQTVVLIPAVLITAYFVVGMIAFAIRGALLGVLRDREMETRGSSVLVGAYLRHYFAWVIGPLWRLVTASGLSANTVTALAALLGAAAGIAVAFGHFALGGWLFLFSGIFDVMDGRLARARGQVSPAGAAIDSVLDRYVDAAMLMGLCWYFRGSWILAAALAALLGTSLVPYVRAKAESLGLAMRDGLMQRTERMLYLGAAVTLSPLCEALLAPGAARPTHRLAAAGVVFLAISTNITAFARFRSLVTALVRKPSLWPPTAPPDSLSTRAQSGAHGRRAQIEGQSGTLS